MITCKCGEMKPEQIKLKQKCIDCNVNLIWFKEMDRKFNVWIKKEIKEERIPIKNQKNFLGHKTIWCPKCNACYNKDFKKMKHKLAFLSGVK